jgi:Fibronectin type III domain
MHGSNSKNALGTVTILLAVTLAACSGGGDDNNGKPAAPTSSGSTSTTTTTGTGSTPAPVPLSIKGAPNRQALANQPYWFRPVATDPNGALLQFGIANQPHWSTFNAVTGELTGVPQMADVGVYHGVTVTVTAGTQMRALAFDVEVVQVGTRSVALTWEPPTENNDGTPLTNLAGYRIRYGTQSGNYTSVVNLDNPGLATYVVAGLASGTYFFVISAYNQNGVESQLSNEATTTT